MSRLDKLINELCPDGVEYKELKRICKSLNKGTLKKEELLRKGEYPVINSGRDIYGMYNNYNNEGNAFTIASRGEYAGFINYLFKKFWAGGLCYPYCSADEKKIKTKYIYYYLKNIEKYIKDKLVIRGGIPALNKVDVENLKIPIPPLEVQNEIVRILDNFTSLSEELSENLLAELNARQKQYNYYRDKQFLDLKDVKRYNLNEIATIYDGTHQTPKYTSSGINFISVENINDIYNSKKFISEEDYNKYKIKPQINDVFMTRIGSIGKCAVFNKEADIAYYVSLALIRPNNKIVDSYYLKYLIESIIGRKELRKRTLINAVPIKINKDDIGKILLPIPSLEEQKRIVSILDEFDKLSNDISEGLATEIKARQKQYEYYRDKLFITDRELGSNY